MTLLLIGATATSVAAAADGWTKMALGGKDVVEHEAQKKVTTAFNRFVVATAGAEYLLDMNRFDYALVWKGERPTDRWHPDREASESRRHHLAGESSVLEIVDRFVEAQSHEVADAARRTPDVEAFHHAVSGELHEILTVERRQAAEMKGKLRLPNGRLIVFTMGIEPTAGPRLFETTFTFGQSSLSAEVVEYSPPEEGEVIVLDGAGGADGWMGRFEREFDHGDPDALGAALLKTVEGEISRATIGAGETLPEIGGFAHGAQATSAGTSSTVSATGYHLDAAKREVEAARASWLNRRRS